MKFKLYWSLAMRNLKANRALIIPFILSSTMMFSLLYIVISLNTSDYVRTRHPSLPLVMGLATVVIAILAIIFMIYANRLLSKRRNQEFALYGILGLEKRHIGHIVCLENLVLLFINTLFSVSAGYIFGQLNFVFLTRLIGDKISSIKDYPFSIFAAIVTAALITFVFILLTLGTLLKVRLSNPIALIGQQKSGEKEPRSRWILCVMGLILIGSGYYLALTSKSLLASIPIFFIAVLLVILGTYALFVSFITIVLKALRQNKNYYYKASNFLSTSGMLYRMKSNAVGLASIAILSTGIILAITSTVSIYRAIDYHLDSLMPHGSMYSITNKTIDNALSEEQVMRIRDDIKSQVHTEIDKIADAKLAKDFSYLSSIVIAQKEGNIIKKVSQTDGFFSFSEDMFYFFLEPYEDYQKRTGDTRKLEDNQIFISSNFDDNVAGKKLILNDKEYHTLDSMAKVPNAMAFDTYWIVVKDFAEFQAINDYYFTANNAEDKPINTLTYNWALTGHSEAFESHINDWFKSLDLNTNNIKSLDTLKLLSSELADFYGGFVYLGLVISAILLVGTVLVIYYKQITEGYEDKRQFTIMQQVGLPDELIKKSANKQIFWLFFLPIAVAITHALVASPILYKLLQLFGLKGYSKLLLILGLVVAVFIISYLIIYFLTSRSYFHIVKKGEHESPQVLS